jgi:predicted dehydrogenase
MGISLGLVGLGSFGSAFADLFRSHPLVDRIGLCDMDPARVERFATSSFLPAKFSARDTFSSLEDICAADFDALVIITQPWLHAPQCVQAMESGKHVYSAVPIITVPDDSETLDWIDKLVAASRQTGQFYMLGETTVFHPQTMFCRRMAATGRFGDFVYAEGEYCHDVDASCNLRQVMQSRTTNPAGRDYAERIAAYVERGHRLGPMHYPTHSTSGPVAVMQAHALKVNAYGYANRTDDPFFRNYAFSNEFALFKMSNGATVRIAETREAPGALGKDSETFRIMGTCGTFSEDRFFAIDRPDLSAVDLADLPRPTAETLTAAEMREPLPTEVEAAFKAAMNQEVDESDLQNLDFNPRGHGGSHPYLVHEFVDAVASGRQPLINIWEAARYMAMGVAAHQSALQDGETVNVPDWGDAPQ